ncbi:hypothetical protein A3G98_00075 [Candidatus Nomurabacteria bacterium RIFCSPLOWO2_12_FULL_37_8]|uniref:Uncharacterized protein n=1 Tax=Candidatus Nomurabacteria bacterium RIFCSPLOWO2_12_FULL_37_8 TaxID=1801793 RepID=A0A1F6Y4K8_9BACT|nr:MAG: hypothetical protein A3G98_00075 [Candidatus Nomurabacteria bacterium RIFCSPLOWO2_12_FULL_37_8]
MEKIKQFLEGETGKDVLIVIIVVLVGLGSFELGRLSKNSSNAGIKIEYQNKIINQEANVVSATDNILKPTFDTKSAGKTFFASNRGSKYYSLGCSGGKTIKQENRIYFTTSAEAETAGYELSSSCR